MHTFKAVLDIIGVNPFVLVPNEILEHLFEQFGKNKGQIPICGTVNDQPYQQTLVKFSGEWRLYINTSMLKNSPQRIGETLEISIQFDTSDRTIAMPPKLAAALEVNLDAKLVLEGLPASRQKEIVRYIAKLKSEESVDKNIQRAIDFLLGKTRFVGRDKP